MTNLKGSFATLYDTVVHLYQADRVWLDRLEGRPSGQLSDYESPGCMWDLATEWREIQGRLLAIGQSLEAGDVETIINYRNLAGQPFSTPVWQVILHVVNHGTHHRGQVVTMLRQLGQTPNNIDLVRFHRTNAAAQFAEPVGGVK
jgi:uncharacterized damage-inducible protein DinB